MLDQNQIENYRHNGFLSGIPVVKAEEARHNRECFDKLEAIEGREKSQIGLGDVHLDHLFVWEIVTNPKILDCVVSLIGPNVIALGSHFFCKYGPDVQFVAWHQDLRYWGLDPPEAVSAWYAFDDSDIENGCMRIIPGFQKNRLLKHGKSPGKGNLLSINQEIQIDESVEQLAVNCVLKAGEISLHDGMAIHGSLPNRSSRRRCGLAIPYIPTHVKPTLGWISSGDQSWSGG